MAIGRYWPPLAARRLGGAWGAGCKTGRAARPQLAVGSPAHRRPRIWRTRHRHIRLFAGQWAWKRVSFTRTGARSMASQRSTRRGFLQTTAALAAGVGLGGAGAGRSLAEQADAVPAKATAREDTRARRDPNQPFSISLAEWSLHKALFAKKVEHLDFAKIAKKDFGIDAVEYVNQFFMDKAKDRSYLAEMKKRCDGLGVRSALIMCDDEGMLGDPD